MSTKPVQLKVHLLNRRVFTINTHIDKAIAQIKWARRTGEPLEWPESETTTMVIFPEMILGYSVVCAEKQPAATQKQEKQAS